MIKGTILIVDDTPTNVLVLAGCLNNAGYQILVAEDGYSALEQLDHVKPDLILLDVMMPGIDGFDTCQQIKARQDTKDIPVLFTTALSELSGKVKGFSVGAVDYITKPYQQAEVLARVNAHITLRRQQKQLEEMLALREKFMRIAAHDLRNPLTMVLVWAEIGCDDAKEDGRIVYKDYFERINKGAQQMKEIINDFLSLQIINGQKQSAPFALFDVNQVVDQVASQHAHVGQTKNITLYWEHSDQPLAAFGGMALTHQIITNYVSNAFKYNPLGTSIWISAKRVEDRVRVEVKDQGPGIPAADRHRLFMEFSRFSNKPTGGETSTGLGLAIVKYLAEKQQGCVGAEFPAEGGSIFWFEMPACAPK